MGEKGRERKRMRENERQNKEENEEENGGKKVKSRTRGIDREFVVGDNEREKWKESKDPRGL